MSALDQSPAYPDAPGHRGVDTSIDAAESVAPKLGRLQKLTLEAIKSRGAQGLTADEAAEVLEQDRYSIQPRTSELRRKGQIIDSGKRRRNATGKSAIVWVAREFEQGPGQ
ncbi:MAG: hypothetical protein ACLGHC_01895 [Alphaproteobacteria bacterium]